MGMATGGSQLGRYDPKRVNKLVGDLQDRVKELESGIKEAARSLKESGYLDYRTLEKLAEEQGKC